METAFVIARFVQYGAASILFGSALLLAWSRIDLPGTRAMLLSGGVALVLAACAGLLVQTAMLTGTLAEALQPGTLALVMETMAFGPAAAVRIVAGVLAILTLMLLPSGRQPILLAAVCGAIACISFAWSGHAAATEGPARLYHLASDAMHALAAAGWIGALIVFARLAYLAARGRDQALLLAQALLDFSPLGIGLVALLVLTGLANGWFIFDTAAPEVATTAYGQLLVLKLGLFVFMCALALRHRRTLAPGLARSLEQSGSAPPKPILQLRQSLGAEALAGVAILALVAAIGLLDPLA